MKTKLHLFAAFFVLLLITSCGSVAKNLYIPMEANALKASVSVTDLIAGKDLYLTRCNECHKLNKPSRYSDSQWVNILDKMQEKAKITDAQKGLIHSYLTAEIIEK